MILWLWLIHLSPLSFSLASTPVKRGLGYSAPTTLLGGPSETRHLISGSCFKGNCLFVPAVVSLTPGCNYIHSIRRRSWLIWHLPPLAGYEAFRALAGASAESVKCCQEGSGMFRHRRLQFSARGWLLRLAFRSTVSTWMDSQQRGNDFNQLTGHEGHPSSIV